MYLKNLTISSNKGIIRDINFHIGSNLIVDQTTKDIHATGNNIGKTTVLALIDYCLGGDSEQIYKDPETKNNIMLVKDFLEEKEVLISLTLKEDLAIEESKEINIQRNFLQRKKKVMKVNGKDLPKKQEKDLSEYLSEKIIGERDSQKPSFRQIISHNIRYSDRKIDNTLRYLSHFTTRFEYETLFLYMLGLSVSDRSVLAQKLKTEKNYKTRIEKTLSKQEVKFQKDIVKREISRLETRKNNLNVNEQYDEDLKKLNDIKLEISTLNSRIYNLRLKKQLLVETKEELQKDMSEIDTRELREIYSVANKNIDSIQYSFEKMVDYHNQMIIEKIKFLTQDIPTLDKEIDWNEDILNDLIEKEKRLAYQLSKSDSFEDLEKNLEELTQQYQRLGELNNSLEQITTVEKNIDKINDEIKLLGDDRFSDEFQEKLTEKIFSFNAIFARVSNELYGEQYGIKYEIKVDKKTSQKYYHFECFNANTSSGKKQGEIVCFDLAYTLYARQEEIPHFSFLLNDKKELMHGNQLRTVSEFATKNKIQLVFSILADKLPEELVNGENVVVTLSDKEKLFKIESSSEVE